MQYQTYVLYLCFFMEKIHNFITTKIILFFKLLKIQLLSPLYKADTYQVWSLQGIWFRLGYFPQHPSRPGSHTRSGACFLLYSHSIYYQSSRVNVTKWEPLWRMEKERNKPGLSQWVQERARGSLPVNTYPYQHPLSIRATLWTPTDSFHQECESAICRSHLQRK